MSEEEIHKAFEKVWESSRTNDRSWAYPTFLPIACVLLIAMSFIRRPWWRRSIKLIALFTFSFSATMLSSWDIEEKWRIRRSWAESQPDRMTEAVANALAADTNYTIGPLVFGFEAFLKFSGLLFILFLVREWWQNARATSDDSEQSPIRTNL